VCAPSVVEIVVVTTDFAAFSLMAVVLPEST
jgi:hypothetical protein